MATIHLCTFLIVSTTITSQSTRCVWDSIDDWDHLNGEYIESGTWNNGKNTNSYWKRDSPSCSDIEQYILSMYDSKDKMGSSFWSIYPSLTNSFHDKPDCLNDDKNSASDPSQCDKGWAVYTSDKDKTNIPLHVADGLCPSLPCVRIQVSNSGESACNHIFSRDFTKEHVYRYTDQGATTYLFFNIHTFKWHCSNTLDDTYCGDDSGINAILSSKLDGWDQVALNGQFTLKMDNDWTATFDCLDGTLDPTPAPSAPPSLPPSKSPTEYPTPSPIAPTDQSTPSPSKFPSRTPTTRPTKQPSQSPTPSPSSNPTKKPTPSPTPNPTDKPTTLSPTPPGTIECGDLDVGDYNGGVLTFMVRVRARGDLTFDATQSQFTITAMEATTELGTVLLDTDIDGDQIITITDTPPGNYKFSIFGLDQTDVIYVVQTSCITKAPTPAPTRSPSPVPTDSPSDEPTPSPTADPSKNPTPLPTPAPTRGPVIVTQAPTKVPTVLPSISPTIRPTNTPSLNPTNTPLMVATGSESKESNDESDQNSIGGELEGSVFGLNYIVLGFIGITCVMSLIVVCGWCVYYRKKRRKAKAHQKNTGQSNQNEGEGANPTTVERDTALPRPNVRRMRVVTEENIEMEQAAVVPEYTTNAIQPMRPVKVDKPVVDAMEANMNAMAANMMGLHRIQSLSSAEAKEVVRDNEIENELDDETSSSAADDLYGSVPAQRTAGYMDEAQARRDLGAGGGEANYQAPQKEVGDAYGLCTDCMQNKAGRLYEGDGLFYCDVCWRKYED